MIELELIEKLLKYGYTIIDINIKDFEILLKYEDSLGARLSLKRLYGKDIVFEFMKFFKECIKVFEIYDTESIIEVKGTCEPTLIKIYKKKMKKVRTINDFLDLVNDFLSIV